MILVATIDKVGMCPAALSGEYSMWWQVVIRTKKGYHKERGLLHDSRRQTTMTLLLLTLLLILLLAQVAYGFNIPSSSVGLLQSSSSSSRLCNTLRQSSLNHYDRRRIRRRCTNTTVLYSSNDNDIDIRDDIEDSGGINNVDSSAISQQQSTPKQISSSDSDYTPRQLLSLMGTSPRRIFLSLTTSTAIALTTNLFGITSNILSTIPEETVEKLGGIDTFYPRGNYKRVIVRGVSKSSVPGVPSTTSNSVKCTYLIPKDWVADTSLALAQAQRQAKVLDYNMSNNQQQQQKVLPDAAYGPPGKGDTDGLSNRDTNVSIIINTDVTNFKLSSLGNDAKSAAEQLLASRPNAQLISANEDTRGKDNIPIYQFEYTVDRTSKGLASLRAISVVAGSLNGDAFITLTVVSTKDEWDNIPAVNEKLRKVVDSFKLF